MKKLIAAAAIGAAVTNGSLLGAGAANASEASFENAVYSSTGLSGSDIVDLGYTTCNAITASKNADLPASGTLGALVGIYIDNGFSSHDTASVIAYSVTELCPSNIDYAYEGVDRASGGSLYA